jgi:hypothetical protein
MGSFGGQTAKGVGNCFGAENPEAPVPDTFYHAKDLAEQGLTEEQIENNRQVLREVAAAKAAYARMEEIGAEWACRRTEEGWEP